MKKGISEDRKLRRRLDKLTDSIKKRQEQTRFRKTVNRWSVPNSPLIRQEARRCWRGNIGWAAGDALYS